MTKIFSAEKNAKYLSNSEEKKTLTVRKKYFKNVEKLVSFN